MVATKNSQKTLNFPRQIDPVSLENDEHKTPLHKAVDLGHVAMVMTLIDAGADVDSRDHWGVTPVFTAVFSNNVPITRLLIQVLLCYVLLS